MATANSTCYHVILAIRIFTMDLILRLCLAARAFGQYLYLYGYALPCLRAYSVLTSAVSVCRGYGTFILINRYLFAKLAVSKNSRIDVEFHHYLALTAEPAMASFVPSYRYFKGVFVSALVCEILYKVRHDDLLSHAVCIQQQLDLVGVSRSRLTLANCPQIQAGLTKFDQEFGSVITNKIRRIAIKYLAFGDYSVGLVHGDFHVDNIMLDAIGNCRLIDLDCIRYHGIRQFDPLYFALKLDCLTTNLLWIDSLCVSFATAGSNIAQSLNAFGISWSFGFGLTFCMDRIGQEQISHHVICPRSRLLPVFQALLCIDEDTC